MERMHYEACVLMGFTRYSLTNAKDDMSTIGQSFLGGNNPSSLADRGRGVIIGRTKLAWTMDPSVG